MRKVCNKCGFQQDEFLKIGGNNYCNGCDSIIEVNNSNIQDSLTLSAHDKLLIFENFNYLLEGLEEFIEKAGYYSNFRERRQFKNITVKEVNFPLENAENLFRTRLLIFVGMDTPNFLREKVKKELYKWVDAVGIDVNSCPERLKHFLLEINNVIEGSEKIVEQTQEYLDNKYKNNPPSWENLNKVFGSIQVPMKKKRDEAKLYEGKSHSQLKNSNKVKGDVGKGRQVFEQLTGSISSDNFRFFGQKDQPIRNPNYNPLIDDPSEEFLNSSSLTSSSNTVQPIDPQQHSNSEIIQDVKNNPRN